MNFITISGGTKSQRQLAGDVASYAVHTLLPRFSTLDIEIKLKKISDADGWTWEEDHNSYQIEIEKTLSKDDFITCILHEMVHVKQGARKELVDSHGTRYWMGKDYSNTFYFNLPWEKEAYGLQEDLLISYYDFVNTTEYLTGIHKRRSKVFS